MVYGQLLEDHGAIQRLARDWGPVCMYAMWGHIMWRIQTFGHWGGGNLISFPVSNVYFSLESKSVAKLDVDYCGAIARFSPPGSATVYMCLFVCMYDIVHVYTVMHVCVSMPAWMYIHHTCVCLYLLKYY